ncbi:metallophosphoesterase family protein [Spirosoma fluminis]
MIRIGLLSDTHSYLDPQIFTHFAECNEIWHAGDVGNLAIVEQLSAFRPLRIVSGNIDQESIQLPAHLHFTLEGVRVWMTHIGGTPPTYNPAVRSEIRLNPPDVFVCGHSHILKVTRDSARNNLLFINPGAAGKTGFHLTRTAVRFTLDAGRVTDMQAIELGKR